MKMQLELKWICSDPKIPLPNGIKFGGTGYASTKGELISVWIELAQPWTNKHDTSRAEISNVIIGTDAFVASIGEEFVVTSGVVPVAKGIVLGMSSR